MTDHQRLNALEGVLKQSVSKMLYPEFPLIATTVNELVFHNPFTIPENRKGQELDNLFDGGVQPFDDIPDQVQDRSEAYRSFLHTLAELIPSNPTIPNEEYYTEKLVLDVAGGNVVARHKKEYLFVIKTDELMSQNLTFPHALWLIREPGAEMLVTMIAIHATIIMDGAEYMADEIMMYGMKGRWAEIAMQFSNESPLVVGGSPFRIDDTDNTPTLAVKKEKISTKGMWSQHGFPTPSVYVANYYASSIYKLKELLKGVDWNAQRSGN